jgi:4'-phosphopantetheinyl transferase EntD
VGADTRTSASAGAPRLPSPDAGAIGVPDFGLPEVKLGLRRVVPADESSLFPEERTALARASAVARARSATARVLARQILAAFGQAQAALPRTAQGPPAWPDGWVGSLAHDDAFAAAAVGRRSAYRSLGVDIEPAEPLPGELASLVATPRERRLHGTEGLIGRTLFVVKEAVYKATSPLDGAFLDFHDVEVDLAGLGARTRTGRSLPFRYATAPRLVALAFVPEEAPRGLP